MNDGWSEPRDAESVLPAVEEVLRDLPGAEVAGPIEIEHPRYRAVAYDVVFTPRSKRGKKYRVLPARMREPGGGPGVGSGPGWSQEDGGCPGPRESCRWR
jgi:hypothetical protein